MMTKGICYGPYHQMPGYYPMGCILLKGSSFSDLGAVSLCLTLVLIFYIYI